jgi:tRNA G10  N-methylase Trm11
MFLQKFINAVMLNENFKTSEALVAFLSMIDRGQFESKMRELTSYQPSPYAEDLKTLTGKLTVVDDEENEKYYTNINNYFKLQGQLLDRLNYNLKNFYLNINAACTNLEEVQKDFETLALLNTRVLMKDEVTVGLDSTGDSLHKRGYRKLTAKAPIAENLAAALIMLTPWKQDRILIDPFCGSGTIPIEAAMMAANMAPGMNRNFIAQNWKHIVDKRFWYDSVDEANEILTLDIETDIQGFDIDEKMVEIARANAKLAGVDKLIHFQKRPVEALSHAKKYGFIITNPPYGERIEEKKNLPALYKTIGERYKALDSWSLYMITAYENAEKDIGRKADKNRKIYNGMMKTYFYQFQGPKPPRRE